MKTIIHYSLFIIQKLGKKVILAILALIIIGAPVLYLTILNSKSAQAAWFDDNWAFRKAIPVTNNTTAETNVYISVTVDTSSTTSFQAHCEDVRFTKQNGELLPYYLYTDLCRSGSSVFHVEFDTFPAGSQTIYVYYGNPSASKGSVAADFSTVASNYTVGTIATQENAPSPSLYYKFDDGQGTTAQDSTSNNLDGTLNNTPTWQTENMCISGKCLYFSGTANMNVSKADDPLLDFGTGSFSVGAWVKRNGVSSANNVILTKSTANIGTTYTGYKLYMDASGDLCFDTQDGTNAVDTACTSAVDFDDNSWHYVSGVKNATTSLTLYVDGKSRATDSSIASTATLSNASTFYIGVDSDGTTTEWLGFIDEVKVYDFALSAAEVKANFTSRGSVKGVSAQMGGADQKYLSDGLVGYWKLDESSWNGTSNEVVDTSGNGNHGTSTCTGGGCTVPTTATAKFGNGGSFDGTEDYVNAGSPSSLDNLTQKTVSAWIKRTNISSTRSIVSKDEQAGGGLWTIEIRGNGQSAGPNTVRYWSGFTGGSAMWFGSTLLTDTSTWYHIVVTYDRSSTANMPKIYINGKADTVTNSIAPTGSASDDNAANLRIGTDSWFELFQGNIDDVRIYNRILSPKEVSDLYNFAPGPVGYWNFEEGSGSTANDISGNAYSGTITGATYQSGKFGKALNFNGSTDAVGSISSISGINTVSFWVNPSSTTANLIDVQTSPGTINISASSGTISATGFTSPTYYINGVQTASPTLTANTWQYITVTSATAVTGSALRFGRISTTSLTGKLDEIKLYNYVRTQKQIVEDVNGGHPAVGSPVGSAVAHWKFDEGYLTTANDSTSNDNDLTLSSASWTNSGKFGKAWNGTGALWLSRADDSDFDVTDTDDYTVSLWFKSDAAANPGPGATEYLFNKANATTAGYAVYANTDGTVCFGIDDDTTWGPDVSSCTPTDIYDNTWHHLVAVRDHAGTDKTLLYVDGILKDSDSDTTTATLANSLSLYLGDRDGVDNGDEFNGDLDEVKVYRYALTADDVKTEYNRGSSMVLGTLGNNSTYQSNAANQEYCIPGDSTSCAAPVGRYDFEEGSGTNTQDSSSGGNTGSITGATYTAGKQGKALNFNGSTDTVTVSNTLSTKTVEFWVNPSTTTQNLMDLRTAATAANISVSGGTISATGFPATVTIYVNGVVSSTITANTWQHIAVTTTGTAISANAIQFGRISTTSLTGKLDSIRFYDYTRTPAQIAWDYNKGAPVAHWKLDECQGTTAHDSSGNNHNSTITIGATGSQDAVGTCTDGTSTHAWNNGATGKRNASLKLDGTNDYIEIADPANGSLDFSGSFTLSAWIKRSTTGSYQRIFSKDNGVNGGYVLLFNNNDTLTGVFLDTDNASHGPTTANNFTSTTSWYHIVFVNNSGSNQKIYVNGVQQASSTDATTGADSGTALVIGASYVYAQPLAGQIDDVQIFNYALTATQVKNLYNNGALFFGPSSGNP